MKIKFNEIANFVAGQSPKSEYYSEEEGTPFLQGNRTFGIFYPKIDTYTKKVTKIAHKGDILMSVRAPVGDLNFAPLDVCIGRGLASITAKNGDNAFLFYALKYNIKNLIRQSNGTTYDSVTGDIVKDMDMIIPKSKVSWKKISNLLYSLDSKIENNNKIISELESMTQIIYDYWFLQFEFPNEEGKPYKSSGGDMIWNEQLNKKIPKGWKVKKVKQLLDVITGKKDANFASHNGKYKFFTCSNEILRCDEFDYEGKSVLIAGNGDFNVKYFDGKFNAYQRTYILIPKKEEYVGLIYQNTIRKIDAFKKGSNGSIVKFITKSDVDDIEILIPNDENLMDVFNENLNVIQLLKNENEELKSLGDYLLPILMNGQVGFRVKGRN